MQIVVNKLEAIRKEKGMTVMDIVNGVSKIAVAFGKEKMTRSAYYHYLRGSSASPERVLMIATVMDTKPEKLFRVWINTLRLNEFKKFYEKSKKGEK